MRKRPKICLFTAHAPSGGGGGAILRSLVPHLAEDFDICWCYLSQAPDVAYPVGWLGKPLIGSAGPILDIIQTGSILAGCRFRAWDRLVSELRNVDCDAYWIVSHNEGLGVARDLVALSGRPVHLTIHDDWSGALCARSDRYRLFGPLAERLTLQVLRRVSSVDVVSEGMRLHYCQQAGVGSEIIHRFLPTLPVFSERSPSEELVVGHIGSIYSLGELLGLLKSLQAICRERGQRGRVRLWGCHLQERDIPPELKAWIELCPHADEAKVIEELQQCRFVYAMYPFTPRLRRFANTSLPTKLSSYVLAQRPILAHGPSSSSLAEFLHKTSLGVLWDNMDLTCGQRVVTALCGTLVKPQAWEHARAAYFGASNVEILKSTFSRLAITATRD